MLSSCDCINEEGEYFFLFGNSIHHRYNYWITCYLKTGYYPFDLFSPCVTQYDVELKQIFTKQLIEYINNNSNDYVEYNFNDYSDVRTDSEEKFDQMPKNNF